MRNNIEKYKKTLIFDDTNQIEFSIIIPCYNVENYIERTIDSVLSQTYNNFELILINDGSTDSTLKMLEKLKRKDKRIKILTQENLGVSMSRNLGIANSQGKYIYFLDGDDLIDSNLLETANNIFQGREIDMFSFGFDIEDQEVVKKYTFSKFNKNIFNSKDYLKSFLNKEIKYNICSFIIRKDLIKNIKFDTTLSHGEDLDFQMRILLQKDFNIFYSSEIFFHYIKRKNSVTTSCELNNKFFNTLYSLENLRKEMLLNNISEFKNYHIDRFFYTILELIRKKISIKNWKKTKLILKKYDYVLKEFEFRPKKREILMLILILLYKINFKLLIKVLSMRK